MDQCGNDVGTQTKPQAQRSNLKVHVCWHRNTSISMKDELIAVEVCKQFFNGTKSLLTCSRINFRGIYYENLKAVTVGKNYGLC